MRQRFPTHINDNAKRAVKALALAEMHAITQGDLMSGEYIERANDLFSIPSKDQSHIQATKFIDGIKDSGVLIRALDLQAIERQRD